MLGYLALCIEFHCDVVLFTSLVADTSIWYGCNYSSHFQWPPKLGGCACGRYIAITFLVQSAFEAIAAT